MRYMKTDLEKYRIKGKIYYKVEELEVKEEDRCVASAMWTVKNVKGDMFRLIFRNGASKVYSLYNDKGALVLRTRSISQVTDR